MSGWSKRKRQTVETAFYEFLNRCFIDSKDGGRICLGDNLYWGQIHAITSIFDALEDDIHDVYFLKSRQLGISTIVRAVTVFFLGIHTGLKGALVFDTAPNREEARQELVSMIRNLPTSLKFPKVKGTGEGNREGLTLENDSRILFKSAGVKKSKSSGTLGRSVGLAFATLSELCSYDNDEGLIAFQESLSDINPDRLYIYESTARGYNKWWEMWSDAVKDMLHKKCIFLGWWSKESQRIDRDHRDWAVYGEPPLSEREQLLTKEVSERYGYDISMEQWAWYRRRMAPSEIDQGDEAEFEGSTTQVQEQPTTEEEAFQQTGSVFFQSKALTDMTNEYVAKEKWRYFYSAGVEFVDMRIYPARTYKEIHLKVWEEPDPEGVYCLAIDPAFGENENNDRSSIQVVKCYADGIDQVAEYASPLITTKQLAWAAVSLMGWYGGGQKSEIRYILELNGPGQGVFDELRSLKHQIESNYQRAEYEAQGLENVFRNVRTYLYSRPDSIGGTSAYHWKTHTGNKIRLMERLRDFVTNGMFHVRSLDLVAEMKTIAREGDSIAAQGSMKDDRVMAAALAVHCWEERVRRQLISGKRTRVAEEARRSVSVVDKVQLFQQNQLQNFFDQKRRARVAQQQTALRMSWRYR